ncbi:unnamed protein product, partial [Haemonchus placei]|uniref:Uncharacterized protein n=1 Tax=Haemonchus placei TaxID=6290 RepID=A0A0N4VV34_HAEPC
MLYCFKKLFQQWHMRLHQHSICSKFLLRWIKIAFFSAIFFELIQWEGNAFIVVVPFNLFLAYR